MTTIVALKGREILDSRGRPTVEAEITLRDGTHARASVPSGASTGSHEALELRDGDPSRYEGRGVRTAVANIDGLLAEVVIGLDVTDQRTVDRALLDADGTADKSVAGANALLASSLAAARAGAMATGIPLWRHLLGNGQPIMPRPMINLISGGLHARRNLDLQDFLIVPVSAQSISKALEDAAAVISATAQLLTERGLSTLHADEGGFGPDLTGHREALDLAMAAIERAGLSPGDDIAFAIDVAASHFFEADSGTYDLRTEQRRVDADGLIEILDGWVAEYPIVSIEDPLAEDDWEGWQRATNRLGSRVELVGDDLFTTNHARVRRGIELGVANSVLVKMNQIGSISETLEVAAQAREAGYGVVTSARSGETEDDALADLSVATGGGQIKVGSLAQSERLAKYNRLLRIVDELGDDAPLRPWRWWR
jgi:enolase